MTRPIRLCVNAHATAGQNVDYSSQSQGKAHKNVLERDKDAGRRHDCDAGLGRGPVEELPGEEVRRLVRVLFVAHNARISKADSLSHISHPVRLGRAVNHKKKAYPELRLVPVLPERLHGQRVHQRGLPLAPSRLALLSRGLELLELPRAGVPVRVELVEGVEGVRRQGSANPSSLVI